MWNSNQKCFVCSSSTVQYTIARVHANKYHVVCSDECFDKYERALTEKITQCGTCSTLIPASEHIKQKNHSTLERGIEGCFHCLPTNYYTCRACRKKVPMFERHGKIIRELPPCSCMTQCKACGSARTNREVMKGGDGCISCLNPLVKSHDYKPRQFHINSCDNEDYEAFTFGLELEYHLGREVHREIFASTIARNINIDRLCYFVNDGSLTINGDRSEGVEIVTHPFTYFNFMDNERFWSVIKEINSLIDPKINDEFPNAGLHIHIGRDAFSTVTLSKMLDFIYSNPKIVSAVSGREFNARYSQCEFPSKAKLDAIIEAHNEKRGAMPHDGRNAKYQMINHSLNQTVEFRTFKSTCDPDTIKKYVEFLYSIYCWVQTIDPNDAYKYPMYFEYILKNSARFPHMASFVSHF